ncbi:hypothetical protein HDU98_002557, partial [Podochytrium sp. JEL0797]
VHDKVDALGKHVKMMEAYPDVGIFNLFMISLFVVPYGAIQAISGVSEFVIGLVIPRQTIAVAFKSWGTNNFIQALALSADLKLGQYRDGGCSILGNSHQPLIYGPTAPPVTA